MNQPLKNSGVGEGSLENVTRCAQRTPPPVIRDPYFVTRPPPPPPVIRDPCPMIRRASRAFTLIELLLVISIVALMMVVAVPSIRAIRGNAPTTGASEVAGVLALARQKAMINRAHTAVVFSVTNHPTATLLSSYCMIQQTNANPVVWIYIDQWHTLPAGAYFSGLPSPALSVPFPANGNPRRNLPAIEFVSRGAISDGTVSPSYAIMEGTIMTNLFRSPLYTVVVMSSNADNCASGLVYRTTGAVRVFK